MQLEPDLTSQGTASGRFQRAVKAGNLFQAELAAREMGSLPLGYALALCRLLGEASDARFERAAVRWHGRFAVERGVERISESQLLLSALAELPGGADEVSAVIRRIARGRGVS
jgi:hypothetical protein